MGEMGMPAKTHCCACSRDMWVDDEDLDDPSFCRACRHKYPPSLLKAVIDDFGSALKLRTGEVIRFVRADPKGDYVTLHTDSEHWGDDFSHPLPYLCPRGVDVRVEDIVWCVDAPDRS
jgi:hypothetical protein